MLCNNFVKNNYSNLNSYSEFKEFTAEWKVWSTVPAYICISELKSQAFSVVNQWKCSDSLDCKTEKPLRLPQPVSSAFPLTIRATPTWSARNNGCVKTANPSHGTRFFCWCHTMTAYPKKGRDRPWLRDTSFCHGVLTWVRGRDRDAGRRRTVGFRPTNQRCDRKLLTSRSGKHSSRRENVRVHPRLVLQRSSNPRDASVRNNSSSRRRRRRRTVRVRWIVAQSWLPFTRFPVQLEPFGFHVK